MASLAASAAVLPMTASRAGLAPAPVPLRPVKKPLSSLALTRRFPADRPPRTSRGFLSTRAEAVDAAVAAVIEPEISPQGSSLFADFVDNTKSIISDAVDAVSDAAESAVDAAEDLVVEVKASGQDLVDKANELLRTSGTAVADVIPDDVTPDVIPVPAGDAAVSVPSVDDALPEINFRGFKVPEFKAPDFKVPEFSGPDLKLPEFKVPEFNFKAPEFHFKAPEFSLPGFKTPDFSLPEFKAPDLGLPEFKAPDLGLPEFGLPEFKQLELPELKAPEFSLPELKAPELPEFKAPEFSLPDFSKPPEFSLPDFSKPPEFSLPDFSKPLEFSLPDFSDPNFGSQLVETLKSKLSEFTPPKIELPDVIKEKLSEIKPPEIVLPESIKSKLPQLPEFTPPPLPSLPSVPTPSLPSVKVPKLSLPPAVTEPVKAAVAQAQEAVQEKVGALSGLVLEKAAVLYDQVKDQVPEEYQPYVVKVETNLDSAWTAAKEFVPGTLSQAGSLVAGSVRSVYGAAGYEVDDSVVTATAIGFGTSLVLIAYYRAVYGGYSGDLTPEQTVKMLRDTKAVLLDLRPEVVRTAEGIPDLRRGARSKDKSLEFEKYTGPMRPQLRNPDAVDLQLFSATLRGLKGVEKSSSIIVMDELGSNQAKDVARGLARFGFERSYILTGGFRAWADEGLRVKPNEPEAIGDVLQNEFEAFVEEVKPTPEGVATVLVGSGLAVYALIEWQRSLQILALLLAAQVIYNRAKTYESSADLDRDIRLVSTPLFLAATALGWIIKTLSGPETTPKLATATAGAESGDIETSITSRSVEGSALPAPAEAALPAAPVELELPAAPVELELPAAPQEELLPPPPEEKELPPAPEEPALPPAAEAAAAEAAPAALDTSQETVSNGSAAESASAPLTETQSV